MEYDVASNQAAAAEMLRRSGQMAVPVILVDGEVMIGFDRARLETALAAQKPSLGARVADASTRGLPPGAYVGGVRPGSAGERAGLRPGDIIIEVEGQAVRGAEDLQRAVSLMSRGATVAFTVLRGGNRLLLRGGL